MRLLTPLGLFVLLTLFVQTGPLFAQSTQFTYQGSLKNGASPATGNHDFEFLLFDALSGGIQLGSTVTTNAVPVNDGIFTVQLNFGNQFPGANRFLEVRLRPTGGGAFTPLAPRQLMTSAPYSVKSLNADTAATATNAAQLGGVVANQYVLTGDTRLSDARNPLPGNGSYIQNQNDDAQPSSNFFISGLGHANIFHADTRYNLAGNHILSAAGTNNLFAGNGAGVVNTGINNSFFGSTSGDVNTSGHNNSFFGASAGGANSVGESNSFFGSLAGSNNNGGVHNTFIGQRAGRLNTGNALDSTGSWNTFVGSNAGTANSTGSRNVFVGYAAGLVNTTGEDNSYLGDLAGSANTIGSRNTGFGAGVGSVTGSENSFFGMEAGDGTGSGERNSFFGYRAGDTNTTGDDNTVIGHLADVASINLNFATAIGAGAVVSASNTMVLGRSADTVQIPGTLGPVSIVGQADIMGQLGVGTTAPEKELHVRGPGDQEIMIESSDASGRKWTMQASDGASTGRFEIIDRTAGASRLIIFNDGDVGIGVTSGTVSLADKLRVNGDIRIGDFSTSFGCVKDNGANVIAGTCSSDLRLKKNITPYGNVLSAFSKLRPVTFDWRADEFKERQFGTDRSFGLVAQEVEAAFPDLVSTDKEGMKAVNYSKLPLLTIQAVNELQTRIEEQNTEITSLRKKLEEQNSAMASFRAELNALKRPIPKMRAKNRR